MRSRTRELPARNVGERAGLDERPRSEMSISAERRAVAAIVLATLLWGGTFVAIRDAVAAISPAALVVGRFACAGALFALVLAVRRRAPRGRELGGGALSGVLMAGGFYF